MKKEDNFKGNTKATQFPHNNPKKGGAPKGKRLKTILAEILENPTKKLKKSLPEGLTGNEALAVELLSIAFSKEVRASDKLNAIKEVMDRLEGKPNQSVEVKESKRITGITIEQIEPPT